jgi:hypothetical protein
MVLKNLGMRGGSGLLDTSSGGATMTVRGPWMERLKAYVEGADEAVLDTGEQTGAGRDHQLVLGVVAHA